MLERFGRMLPKNDTDRRALLELADRSTGGAFDTNDPLANLRGRDLPVVIAHAGGGTTLGRVLLERLDAGGCDVVFPAMMHMGCAVTLTLPLLRGGTKEVACEVEDCRHLTGHMHTLRLRFKEAVDLGMLTPRAKLVIAEATSAETPAVLAGRCLVLGASTLETQMLLHFFGGTSVEAKSVESIGRLLDLAVTSDVDAVIVDHASLGPVPDETLQKLDRLGLRGGTALLVSGNADPSDDDEQRRVIRISRPVTKESLLQALGFLLRGVTAEDTQDIVSTVVDDGTLPMVEEFARLVGEKVEVLARTRDTIEFGDAREIVVEWRDFGATFGFAPLSQAATATLQAMDASCSLEESSRELRTLLSVARRLRPRPVALMTAVAPSVKAA